MPLHDWTRVPAGLYHDFHQSWAIRIKDALNAGLLPRGTMALVEQRSGPREADVLAIESRALPIDLAEEGSGGVAVQSPPATRIFRQSNRNIYAERANRIVVRHHLGRIIAVLEIVSPGNKDMRVALKDFISKTVQYIKERIHVQVIDPFPPSRWSPAGLHKLIWDEVGEEEPFTFPPGKDRLLASYRASLNQAAYVEPVGVGDSLRDMPLFLSSEVHVMVPLENTYLATWEATPHELRTAVETGVLPDPEAD